MPSLTNITVDKVDVNHYPFNVRAFKNGLNLRLNTNVTFFVGENGCGKSTLLEGVAERIGFNLRGGNRNHNLNAGHNFNGYEGALTKQIHLGWSPKMITQGFFMRAESFFNFATHIDDLAVDDPRILLAYGGKSLHHQSHGESFLSLFNNQFESGVYVLDEPEAALSPARILSFMSVINTLESYGRAQFLIATHSPMLLCYPDATIFSFTDTGLERVLVEETEHYVLTRRFLENPQRYFKDLFNHSI